jgi:NTP pyrophosphatase (non-canonical NTP hydrolase)
MKNYQDQVDKWFKENNWQYWSAHEILARLFEEGGEFARLINHVYGPKKKKLDEVSQDMEEEIGDIIYTLIAFANSHNIDLDQAVQKSIDKVITRDKDRYN